MNLVTLLYGIVPESVSHDSACLQGKGIRKGADQNRTGVPFVRSFCSRIVPEKVATVLGRDVSPSASPFSETIRWAGSRPE